MTFGKFEFHGSGIGLFGMWLLNVLLCVITFGLYVPWAIVSIQSWICRNTSIGGQRLAFAGTGWGFFGQYLLIAILTTITFGIYTPWGLCRLLGWQTRNTHFAEPIGGPQPPFVAPPVRAGVAQA